MSIEIYVILHFNSLHFSDMILIVVKYASNAENSHYTTRFG